MSRRPFDSSFSRRPNAGGGGSGSNLGGSKSSSSYSILGEIPGSGGYGGYGSQERGATREDLYASLASGSGGYDDDYDYRSGGGGYEQDKYESLQSLDRIPRDSSRLKSDYGGGSLSRIGGGGGQGGGNGGWRQRSPSPTSLRYSSRIQESERVSRVPQSSSMSSSAWTTRSQPQDLYDDHDRSHLDRYNDQSSSNPFSSSQNNSSSILRNPLGGGGGGGGMGMGLGMGSSSILGQPEPVQVMVLPQGQATGGGGLMGNLGLGNLGLQSANPFQVIGQQQPMQLVMGNLPSFNPSPFGQQVMQQQHQSTPYGPGIGEQSQNNIYGPQTQQPFNSRFGNSSSDDRRSSRGGNNERSRGGQVRRSDPSRSSGGGGGGQGGRTTGTHRGSSSSGRNDAASRKRNLVLRDPRPEDAKRARTSTGSGGGARGNRGGGGKANGKSTQVKRVNLGDVKPNNTGRNRNKPQPGRKSETDKPKVTPKKLEGDKAETPKKKGETEQSKKATPGAGDDKTQKKEKDKKEKDKPTKYDGIPGSLLVCKVCQKVMNDGQSFESHLSGRAHVSLLKLLEERFSKRAELLMIESKCSEEEIGIEMERQRRAGKSGRPEKNQSNYCKMCDCNYTVNWGTHKVGLGHRILKEFLHPTCRFCKTPFMHRTDWVNHLGSPGHLKKLTEIKQEGSVSLEEQESPTQEELFSINVDMSRDDRPTNTLTIRSLDGKEVLTDEMKEILKNDRGEICLPEGDIPIPETYDENTEVGEEAIVAVNGSRCRVCRVYIAENTEVENHCKSKEHFNNYVSFLKRVVRHREHKSREKKAAEEKAKKEEEKRVEADKAAAEKKEAKVNGTTESKGDETAMDVDKVEGEGGEASSGVDGDVVVLDEVEGEGEDEEQVEGEAEGEEQVEGEAEGEEQVEGEGVDEEAGEDLQQEEKMEEEVAEEDAEGQIDPAAEAETVTTAVTDAEIEEVTADSVAGVGELANDDKAAPEEDNAVVELEEEETNDMSQADSTVAASEDTPTITLDETSKIEIVSVSGADASAPAPIVIEVEKKAVEEVTKTAAPITSTPAPQQQTSRRGGRGVPARGGGASTRGTPLPARGGARGGQQQQALKNVTPRVDTNYRGGGGGRGQARGGRPPRGSPRGGGFRGGRGGRGQSR